MKFQKYIIFVCCTIIALLNIIILDIIEVKMCKSFSFFRLFTMNSTACNNITKGINIMETMLTTTILATCSSLFQEVVCYYNSNYNKRQISHNRPEITYK